MDQVGRARETAEKGRRYAVEHGDALKRCLYERRLRDLRVESDRLNAQGVKHYIPKTRRSA
jgi:hypothetical protein